MRQRLTQRFPNKEMVRERFAHNQGLMYIVVAFFFVEYSSLFISGWVVWNSLWPHGLQCSRLPCLALSPGVCSGSCPLSHWCHPAISPSFFSFCLPSFPASESFPVSWIFSSGGQSFGTSTSASVLPVNIQGWFPLGWTDWISLQFKGLSRVFFNTTVWKQQFFSAQPSLWSNSHIYTWLQEKP